MKDKSPILLDGSVKVGNWLIEPGGISIDRKTGWMVSRLDSLNVGGWSYTKEGAIEIALKKTRREGDYGEAVALIAEVMLGGGSR